MLGDPLGDPYQIWLHRQRELEHCRQGERFVPVQPWPTAGWHVYDRLLQLESGGAWYDEPGQPGSGLEACQAVCQRRNEEYRRQVWREKGRL